MRNLNKKGFTLIELLAVIIILGVLLLIAIPSMNAIIEGSKKDAFVSTAKAYIQTVRFEALQNNYELPAPGEYTVVATDLIELEQGSKNSPYDQVMNNDYTFVMIVNAGSNTKDEYVYYYQAVDAKGNGTKGLVAENSLDRDQIIKTDAQTQDTTVSITELNELANDNNDNTNFELNGKVYTRNSIYPAQ